MAKKQKNDAVLALKKGPEIRKIYKPADRERDLIRMVYERKRNMEDSPQRQQAIKNADYYEKLWECWRKDPEPEQWASNYEVPIVFSAVETALSEMVLQRIRPIIGPRSAEDVSRARIMTHAFDYSWEISDTDMAIYDIMQDGLIQGTAFAQEYYWQDKRIIQTRKNPDDPWALEEQEVVDYDDVCLEPVKSQEIFIDEAARSIRGSYGARDAVRRYVMHIDDARTMFSGPIWNPLDNMKFVKPGGDTNYYEFFKPAEMQKDQVEILWYWAVKPKDWLIITINDVLIKFGPNPNKHKQLPFIRNVDTKRTHNLYGKGIAEVLESMQDEAGSIRRMTHDRAHLDLDKMFGVSNRLGIDEEDLIARPHGLIPMDDANGLKPIEYGDTPRSVEIVIKHIEDDAVLSTGINPRAQALPTAGTATEASILKESTLRRINKKLWLMKKLFFVEQARLRVSNIIQFYSQPKLEAIVGEKESKQYQEQIAKANDTGTLTTVDGQDYQKKYRTIGIKGKRLDYNTSSNTLQETKTPGMTFFEMNPSTFVPTHEQGFIISIDAGANIEISKPLARQQAIETYDRIAQAAQLWPGSYDPVKALDDVIRASDKNPDDYKPDPPPQDEAAMRLEQMVQLAAAENKQMFSGVPVPATPNVSPVHTRIHLEAMQSPQFQQGVPKDSPIVKIFTEHVMGEMIAQKTRGSQVEAQPQLGGQQQQPPQPGSAAQQMQQQQAQQQQGPPQPDPNAPKVSVSIKADANTPVGQELLMEENLLKNKAPIVPPPAQPSATQAQPAPAKAATITNGKLNRPGGVAQSKVTMQHVMPNKNNGSSPQLK